jgi:hypothetical protein
MMIIKRLSIGIFLLVCMMSLSIHLLDENDSEISLATQDGKAY